MLRLLRWRFWKSGPCAVAAHPGVALGRFDLDHLRAPVGELAHRGRTGAHARQIDHLEAGERPLRLCRLRFRRIHCTYQLEMVRNGRQIQARIARIVEFVSQGRRRRLWIPPAQRL